jgi:membrane protease subunit HflC
MVAIAVIAAALIIALQTCIFIVRETENAIVIVLGNPQNVVSDAGLNFKLPWADIVKVDKRNLEYDLDRAMEITDVNQERLTVDAFARYRIVEPLVYYQSFKTGAGDEASLRRAGQAGIERIMQNSLRQTLGEVSIDDIVTNLRAELMLRIGQRMESEARKFGVEIIDVKIRRADYPADIAQTVYDQMSSARLEEAELIRSEGRRDNTRIQAEANRTRAEILADANRQSLELTGQADATRNCIFAGAYDGLSVVVDRIEGGAARAAAEIGAAAENGVAAQDGAEADAADAVTDYGFKITCSFVNDASGRDPQRAEFFAFYRSLQAYEAALQDGETTILLSPDSEFFRYFNNLEGRRD